MNDRPLVPRGTVENLLTADPSRTWVGNYGWRANRDGSGLDVTIRAPDGSLRRITQNDRGEFREWDGATRGGRPYNAQGMLAEIRESMLAEAERNPLARARIEALYQQHGINFQTGERVSPRISATSSDGAVEVSAHQSDATPQRYASLQRVTNPDPTPQRTADVDWRTRALTPTV